MIVAMETNCHDVCNGIELQAGFQIGTHCNEIGITNPWRFEF